MIDIAMLNKVIVLDEGQIKYMDDKLKETEEFAADKERLEKINAALEKIAGSTDLQSLLKQENAELRIGDTNLWLTGEGMFYNIGPGSVHALIPIKYKKDDDIDSKFVYNMCKGGEALWLKLVHALHSSNKKVTGNYLLKALEEAKQDIDDYTY